MPPSSSSFLRSESFGPAQDTKAGREQGASECLQRPGAGEQPAEFASTEADAGTGSVCAVPDANFPAFFRGNSFDFLIPSESYRRLAKEVARRRKCRSAIRKSPAAPSFGPFSGAPGASTYGLSATSFIPNSEGAWRCLQLRNVIRIMSA